MINSFSFNGADSRSFGVLVKSRNVYDQPERDVDYVSVPGRNGDLIFDNGRYKNINISYPCRLFAPDSPDSNDNISMAYTIRELKRALRADGNYSILTDTFNPNYFRMAKYTGGITFSDVSKKADVIDFNVNFYCKPQLYRWDGQSTQTFTSSGSGITASIYNPEDQPTKPIIRINGTHTGNTNVIIGSYSITITDLSGYIDIDCETMNAYKGSANLNNSVSGSFPVLNPGTNQIVTTISDVTSIEITPRWWTT